VAAASRAPADRILAWEACYNARDLGGLATPAGHVRRGALIRSDVLIRLTPAGRRAMIDHGVGTIVDVRSADEVARDWQLYPFRSDGIAGAAAPVVDYRNVPFTLGHDERAWAEVSAAYRAAQSREELNRIDLDANTCGIGAIVAAVADARAGGVLIHCHAGKDRTGLIVAVVLALIGVADREIAEDYALTARNFEPLISDWLDAMSDQEVERERLRALARPRPEAMLDTLEYLRARYGSAERYLLDAGVSSEQLLDLRARLLNTA
jgi:protein-tyrosine phosphatase